MPTLDWLNRDAAFRTAAQVPHRLLQAVSTHGNGDTHNLLVQGDNLQALKAPLPLYRAQVKCIFMDHRTTPRVPSSTTTTTWNIRSGCR